jgi:GNAT superfamily N-acetyltransferase
MDDVTIRRLGRPGDLGWVLQAHGELYAAELGWGAPFEALVARIVADFAENPDPGRSAAWITELDGRRVGCVFCVPADEETAQLRVMLVHPDARGHGLGTRLTAECLRFARSAGYRRIRLWTTNLQVAASAIYRAAGFELVATEPHAGFGATVTGQTYELDLDGTSVDRVS